MGRSTVCFDTLLPVPDAAAGTGSLAAWPENVCEHLPSPRPVKVTRRIHAVENAPYKPAECHCCRANHAAYPPRASGQSGRQPL